jgi:hypothetical protein
VNKEAPEYWPAIKAKPETTNGNAPRMIPTVEQHVSTGNSSTNNPVAQFKEQRNREMAAEPSPLDFGATNVPRPRHGSQAAPAPAPQTARK